jgi:hypothetical protein
MAGPRARRLLLVALANLASHPAVWFVFPELGLSYAGWLALAEAWAVSIEALAYGVLLPGTGARRALVVSLAANAASFAAGLGLRALGTS